MGRRFQNQRSTLCHISLWLLCLILFFPLTVSAQDLPRELQQAEFVVLDDEGPPAADADWQPLELPFIGSERGLLAPDSYPRTDTVWFRLRFDRPAYNEAMSLVFSRYNLSIVVYFNGEEVASNPQRPGRTVFAWNRPLMAHISHSQWQDTNNELLLKLTVSPMGAALAPPLLGPREFVEDLYASRMFRQVDINRILLAFAFSISFFTFALWLMRRHDPVYLWFSMMCLAWGVGTSHTVIYYSPISFEHWVPFVHIAIDSCVFFMYGFIGRLAVNVRHPVREKLFMGWTLLAAVINLLLPPQWFWQGTYTMHLAGVTVLGLILLRVARVAVRERQTDAIIIALSILGQLVLFLVNTYLMFFSFRDAWDESLMFAHFGLPVLMLIFAAVLLRRFSDALNTAETLNHELEQKVEESRKIIARSFEERRILEMEQTAEKERLKIYRDLHDDVGSRLLSIIHADTGGKLGNMARTALESLRQAVSKANTPDQPLQRLLADLREETELRLLGSGHSVDWQQENLEDVIVASAVAFNINRIMKELVSNIIRHAQASDVAVQMQRDHNRLQLTVTDNGCGFLPDKVSGNGLNNIRSRSAEIGATVTTESGSRGTRISLDIPIWEPGLKMANA